MTTYTDRYFEVSKQSLLFSILLFGIMLYAGRVNAQPAATWNIPSNGNSFLVQVPSRTGDRMEEWQSNDQHYLFFFWTDRSCIVDLSLNLSVAMGKSLLNVSSETKAFNVKVSGNVSHLVRVGKVRLDKGYHRIELRGITKSGSTYANVAELKLRSKTDKLDVNYVKDNVDNRFYWGRRGPSVHLNYELPAGAEAEYFYNELTVPVGQDPEGSYFMATGFGEGYFGMQVNGPEERRVLFSVWSPYHTDRPAEIPESERIVLLKKGEGVHAGEFGDEGSGGQSYLKTNWKAGKTYGFLLKGTPDGEGNTVYTAWFYDPDAGNRQLIASFKRPKTDHYLSRLHSFLENFEDQNGYLGRKCLYSNTWCMDKNGHVFPLTKARFTGDDIAKRGYRLDYEGGTEKNAFYLRNGGFFNNSGCTLQSSLQLQR